MARKEQDYIRLKKEFDKKLDENIKSFKKQFNFIKDGVDSNDIYAFFSDNSIDDDTYKFVFESIKIDNPTLTYKQFIKDYAYREVGNIKSVNNNNLTERLSKRLENDISVLSNRVDRLNEFKQDLTIEGFINSKGSISSIISTTKTVENNLKYKIAEQKRILRRKVTGAEYQNAKLKLKELEKQLDEIQLSNRKLTREFNSINSRNFKKENYLNLLKVIENDIVKNQQKNVIEKAFKSSVGEKVKGFAQTEWVNEVTKNDLKRFEDQGVTKVKWNLSASHTVKDVCFPADTLILTENGQKKIIDIKHNEKVLTHKGNFKNVVKTFSNGIKETFEVILFDQKQNDIHLRGTHNHPVLTDQGWTNLSDLKMGSNCILFSSNISEQQHQFFYDENHKEKLDSLENDNLHYLQNVYEELCDVTADQMLFDKLNIYKVPHFEEILNVNPSSIWNVFFQCFHLDKKDLKNLSYIDLILILFRVYVGIILFYLNQTLGYSHLSMNNSENKIDESNHQTQKIFYNFYIGKCSKEDRSFETLKKLDYLLSFYKMKNNTMILQTFFENLFYNTDKSISFTFLEVCLQPNINIVTVESVTNFGSEEVFNIEVEDDHTYFANNICVHNCDEIKATDIGYGKGIFLLSNTFKPIEDTHPRCKCYLTKVE